MARFYKYLNESTVEIPLDEINELIQKNCKYYLNLTKGKYIHTRGMITSYPLGEKRVRDDRIAKGMNAYTADIFNEGLEQEGHIRRDSAVIASSKPGPSTMFGMNNYIFPIGKFNYTGVRAKDVNINDGKTGWYESAVENFLIDPEGFDTDYKVKLPKPFHTYFTTNKGISEAYDNNYEIWFNCKAYYFAKINKYVGLEKKLKMRDKEWQGLKPF